MSSKAKTTGVANDGNRALTPKLRFPEFLNAAGWQEARFDEVLSPIVRERKKPSETYTGLGIRSHGKGTFLKPLEDPVKNAMEYLYEVRCDDLIVNITFAWEGAVAIAGRSDDGALVSHRFPTYTFEKGKASPEFFRYIILDKQLVHDLGVISPGGAGRNRVLNRNDFLKLKAFLPKTEEQQRIAACLTSLDELIAAQATKVEALKTKKNGLMQQLFPREGKTHPRLRFPEFRDAEKWRVTKLGALLFEAKHRNRALEFGSSDVLSVSGEHGCVNQIEFMGRSYAGATVKDYHVVEHGDIVYTKSPLKRKPYGIIKENKGKRGIVSTLYAVYRPSPGCSAAYLDHFFSVDYNLNTYLAPLVKKGPKNDMKINNADVLKGDICVPELPEQQKIADCLTSVDELIATQARKLDALNTHKKGLMQQLFPSVEEA